jgi:hypothetical protein
MSAMDVIPSVLTWKAQTTLPGMSLGEALTVIGEWDDEFDSDEYINNRFLRALDVIAQSEDDLDEHQAKMLWQTYTSQCIVYLQGVSKGSFDMKLRGHFGLAIRLLERFGDMEILDHLEYVFSSVSTLSFEADFSKAKEQIGRRIRWKPASQDERAAIGNSVAETVAQEGPGLQDAADLNALIGSKVKSYEEQKLVVLRLTKHNSRVLDAIRKDSNLKTLREQVDEAGCEILPKWAEGCIMLAPLTQHQVKEAGVKLRAHHIVVAQQHQTLVQKALAAVPKRSRPLVMTADPSSTREVLAALDDWESLWDGLWEVEKTFVHVPLNPSLSASSWDIQSEPWGDAAKSGLSKKQKLHHL